LQNVTSKNFLLSLPIALSTIPKPPGMRYAGDFHAISLRNWCKFLVTYSCWHVLCGLVQPNPPRERAILQEFWRRYRLWRPNHDLLGSLLIPETLTLRARRQWFYTAMKAEVSKSQRFCFVLITVTSGGAQTWRIPQGLQNHMFR
jgi:hypothetical protein